MKAGLTDLQLSVIHTNNPIIKLNLAEELGNVPRASAAQYLGNGGFHPRARGALSTLLIRDTQLKGE